jgi:protein-S-isoprenylcysteine O-methyltransferase Ste14
MSPSLLRAAVWLLPSFLTLALITRRTWTPRRGGAMLMSLIWPLWSLPLLDAAARHLGWWHGPTLDAPIPPELLVGWAVLWGPLALLLTSQMRLSVVIGSLLLVDFVLMPQLEPLVFLSTTWMQGEILALTLVLLPAQLLGRWTLHGRQLIARSTLHFVQFTAVVMGWFPWWVLSQTGGPMPSDWPGSAWLHLPLMALALLPGLAAVAAFGERGGGTPVPFDPPPRLVTTGPYAYVANPMQLSFALAFLVLASWSRDPWLCLASTMAVVFGAGVGASIERHTLSRRHGEPWSAWRRHVRKWRPRWRPYTGGEALLLVERGDPWAEGLADFLESRDARELLIVRKDHVNGGLALDPVGSPRALRSTHAAARALEHLHLGWAMVGWVLGLPGVRWLYRRVRGRPSDAPGGDAGPPSDRA